MSESTSEVVTGYAPALVGVWVHDPVNADDSETNYLFASARTESIKPASAAFDVAGRSRPIVEYGELTTVGLKLTILVPFGSDHEEKVEWWRQACLNRRVIIYRDNRGRVHPVALPDGVEASDGRIGTAFSLSLLEVDYTPDA